MNKTRITKLYVVLVALVCLLALCLCACSGSGADGANGANGRDGSNGKSAYEIWLDEGHTGSQADFLNWLKGTDGSDGENGQNGSNGKSAYQIWLDNGHTGTEAEFLDWLKGADGSDGAKGDKGDTGAAGADGVNGTSGKDGVDGADGKDGVDGANGLSAYEIFLKYYPYYTGTEEQWIKGLVNGELRVHTITFKSEVADDIVKYVFEGYALTDIPEVPEKEGQTSAAWSVADFSNITQDMEVTAIYDMRKYVTFHNEFTDDEDIVKTVEYGGAITDIPQITAKVGNDSSWSITDFNEVKTDLFVEAVYQTQGLQYTLINQQTQYRVSKGEIGDQTKELFIPAAYNDKPITVIDTYAFGSCGIETVYIPNSIVEIRDNAFYECRSLTSITIPNSVTSIESGTFIDCWGLTSITIPDSVTSIESRAFSGCSGLTSITIPNSVTSIEHEAFSGCSGLTSITIPDSVTSIESRVFWYCSGLTSITIPDSVTSIGWEAFSGCSGLTSITIPDSVTSIESRAFSGCSKLERIYYKGAQSEFDKMYVASDGNTSFTDSTVYLYSVTAPTGDGYYWHYDTDGKTPVVWIKQN